MPKLLQLLRKPLFSSQEIEETREIEENSSEINENKANNDWSPSLQTLLDQPPASFPFRLVIGGIVFCAAFGAWAWFGQVEQVGNARGQLVPLGETYKIHPIESGKVINVSVEEGEVVEANEVLVELDTELAQKDIERLQQQLNAYRLQLTQKQALLQQVRLEMQTQDAIAMADIQGQQTAIAQAQEKADTARQLLNQLRSELVAYQQRQNKLKPLSGIAQEQLKQLKAEAAEHQERLERLKPLQEEGAISQEYIFQAQQALRQTQQKILQLRQQELSNTDEQLFQAGQSLRDRQSQITQTQGQFAAARRDVERLQAQLAEKQGQKRQIQLQAQEKMQRLQAEIDDIQAQISDTTTLIESAQTKLTHRFLKAPVDGIVLSLNLQNTGQVIQPGQTVAEIAPEDAPLVLSAIVPNSEAGFVEKGMPVHIKLDSYPYQDYGVVPGTVTHISPNAKADDQMGYRVQIELERDYVIENQQKIPFKPGQTATADIILRRRRIADVLLDPIKQLQEGGIDL
ncbi:MAG: HlyD family efflux transporter periplasmic adaptor subunit [Chroococcales cyanobacterium]